MHDTHNETKMSQHFHQSLFVAGPASSSTLWEVMDLCALCDLHEPRLELRVFVDRGLCGVIRVYKSREKSLEAALDLDRVLEERERLERVFVVPVDESTIVKVSL